MNLRVDQETPVFLLTQPCREELEGNVVDTDVFAPDSSPGRDLL